MWSSVHGHAEDRQTTRLWREVNGVWHPEFFYFFLLLLFVFGLEAACTLLHYCGGLVLPGGQSATQPLSQSPSPVRWEEEIRNKKEKRKLIGWDKDTSQLPSWAKQTWFGELKLLWKHMQGRKLQEVQLDTGSGCLEMGWSFPHWGYSEAFWAHSLLMCSSGLTVLEPGGWAKWLLVFTSNLTH